VDGIFDNLHTSAGLFAAAHVLSLQVNDYVTHNIPPLITYLAANETNATGMWIISRKNTAVLQLALYYGMPTKYQ